MFTREASMKIMQIYPLHDPFRMPRGTSATTSETNQFSKFFFISQEKKRNLSNHADFNQRAAPRVPSSDFLLITSPPDQNQDQINSR